MRAGRRPRRLLERDHRLGRRWQFCAHWHRDIAKREVLEPLAPRGVASEKLGDRHGYFRVRGGQACFALHASPR
jgi:hypothetical protein